VTQNYRYVVTVQALDGANNMDTTSLIITVSDVNDNTPRFVSTIKMFAVLEGRPVYPDPKSVVGQVTAADLDHPNSPPITYYISGGGGGKFDVNSTSGVIYLANPVDYEEADHYLMNITATDGARSATLPVVIIINDANDNSPVFSQTLYRGSIREDLPVGTTLDATFDVSGIDLRVNAIDIDTNPVVTYFIDDLDLPFAIHGETGYITLSSPVDREVTEQYRFAVFATDGEHYSLPAYVEIVVHDINDNNPIFSDYFNVTIPEQTPADSVFLFLQATDADTGTNADITYTITTFIPQNSPNTFSISPQGGGISAEQEVRLNSQDPTAVTLTITAANPQASLPPNVISREDVATVIINIMPMSELGPQFNSIHYSFRLNENEGSASVGSVSATSDFGTAIIYSIVQSSTNDGIFVINSNVSWVCDVVPLKSRV